ncbi:hypothetical protein GCM10018783_65890 [Streptomyces griseosporeus]|nr:hypothetical protein GCM10018783_65890 [Streptomyces griseosporeus]
MGEGRRTLKALRCAGWPGWVSVKLPPGNGQCVRIHPTGWDIAVPDPQEVRQLRGHVGEVVQGGPLARLA